MKRSLIYILALGAVLQGLTACMYYAEWDSRRAQTEQVRQKTALMEAYAQCLRVNAADPALCPKPNF